MSFDQDKVSKDEQPMSGDYFPEASPYNAKFVKRLGGFDIFKDQSKGMWHALVVTEDTTKHKKSVTWYRWNLDYGNWKIGYCNMKANDFDFDEIKRKMNILKKIYKIN